MSTTTTPDRRYEAIETLRSAEASLASARQGVIDALASDEALSASTRLYGAEVRAVASALRSAETTNDAVVVDGVQRRLRAWCAEWTEDGESVLRVDLARITEAQRLRIRAVGLERGHGARLQVWSVDHEGDSLVVWSASDDLAGVYWTPHPGGWWVYESSTGWTKEVVHPDGSWYRRQLPSDHPAREHRESAPLSEWIETAG